MIAAAPARIWISPYIAVRSGGGVAGFGEQGGVEVAQDGAGLVAHRRGASHRVARERGDSGRVGTRGVDIAETEPRPRRRKREEVIDVPPDLLRGGGFVARGDVEARDPGQARWRQAALQGACQLLGDIVPVLERLGATLLLALQPEGQRLAVDQGAPTLTSRQLAIARGKPAIGRVTGLRGR